MNRAVCRPVSPRCTAMMLLLPVRLRTMAPQKVKKVLQLRNLVLCVVFFVFLNVVRTCCLTQLRSVWLFVNVFFFIKTTDHVKQPFNPSPSLQFFTSSFPPPLHLHRYHHVPNFCALLPLRGVALSFRRHCRGRYLLPAASQPVCAAVVRPV